MTSERISGECLEFRKNVMKTNDEEGPGSYFDRHNWTCDPQFNTEDDKEEEEATVI